MNGHASFSLTRIALTIAAVAITTPLLDAQAPQSRAPKVVEAAPPRPAQPLVDEAVAQARSSRKNVLVEFGASWCSWCHRFEAFLADSVAGKIMLDHFVVVHLVVTESPGKQALENPGSEVLMKQMGGGNGGIPYFFMLDSAGRKLGDANIMPSHGNVGHPNTPEEVNAFDGLLKVTAPRMSAADRRTVFDYLTRIAGRTAATASAPRH